jgi:hypothetical protein
VVDAFTKCSDKSSASFEEHAGDLCEISDEVWWRKCNLRGGVLLWSFVGRSCRRNQSTVEHLGWLDSTQPADLTLLRR